MNILVLTTIYKDIHDPPNAATTPIVQNFAKEWKKAGHNVLIVHNFNYFPLPLYYVPQKIWDTLSARKGFRTILKKEQRIRKDYTRDGVDVVRLPIFKAIPLGAYSKKELFGSVERIRAILQERAFVPDLIIGHMENPQIFQIVQLKECYKMAKTAIVFHLIDYLNKEKFAEWKNEYLPQIDVVGFRSVGAYLEACQKIGFNRKNYFFCPSGIADEYVKRAPNYEEKFKPNKVRILYVGQLIPRKHAETLIEAVKEVNGYNATNVVLDIIGEGVEYENLKAIAETSSQQNQIIFHGIQPHETVLKKMAESDVFVMVSEREVFGLVYIEAMSQGCIVVASKGEGMEGIIHNGKNGWLCKAGDKSDLVNALKLIIDNSREQNILMAKQSFDTAMQYTESAVAEGYLSKVCATGSEQINK